MGTQPIFESDFDCLTDHVTDEKMGLLTNEERRQKIEKIKQRMRSEETKIQRWNQIKLPLLIGTIAIGIGLLVYFRPTANEKSPISDEL